MFATRNNNENAIYDQQTAAAAKPLNQGVRGLAPKTPAHKAVHKISLNDENAAFKTKGKAKDGGLLGGEGKAVQTDKSAFMTLARTRNRAPLGNKTTNAKATAFQTPGLHNQDKGSVRATSPRLRRTKVKVQVDPLGAADDEEEREIEYMPPREVPLPDHPDDWPADRTYPQFEGKNFTRGWWSITQPYKDEDADELSDLDEKLKKVEERERRKAHSQAQKAPVTAKVPYKLAAKLPDPEYQTPGLTSQGAARALSSIGVERSYAAPTVSTKARMQSTLGANESTSTTPRPGNVHHTAAKVASNTTLGYSKGRTVSANTRKPLSDIHRVPATLDGVSKASPMKMPFGAGTTLDDLLGLTSVNDDDDADTLVGTTSALDALDEEFDDFQLPPL